jgi:pyruvate formate-lyase/glycerol dehydratase family glycyl radical enzyme
VIALTERVETLRASALSWEDTQRAYIGQRLTPALEALGACPPNTPWMKRKARMLAGAIRGFEPLFDPVELVVGYNFSGGEDQQWLEMTLGVQPGAPSAAQREQLHGYLIQGQVSASRIDAVLDLVAGAEHRVPCIGFTPECPGSVGQADAEGLFWCYATPYNHTIIGYRRVLEVGFEGLAAEVRHRLANLEVTSSEDWQAQMLLESSLIVAEAGADLGHRYAQALRARQVEWAEEGKHRDLERLYEVVSEVPAKPARTFHEAVQSLWFAHILNTWEDGINANSLGRLDQILYPYYRADIEAGRLTREEAFELLCCLWIKLYRDYDVQQVVVGGVDADGNDATNELTYLMLDVTDALDFVRCLSVRLHSGSPTALIRRSLELVGKGNGIPFFFNDDVLVPALVDQGIALADARDYAAIGCVEITIPGKANPHAVSNRINLLKCLELALNDGRSLMTGAQVGPPTGAPETMANVEDVWVAYERQVAHFTHEMCRETVRLGLDAALTAPMPYKSLLTEGCLEQGLDFNNRGARYDFHESMPMGIPNVADALEAIRLLVFEQGMLTLPELVTQMRQNFPNEALRQALLNRAPKFGNGDATVDDWAARVFRAYCDLLLKMSKTFDTPFFAQPFTFLWLVDAGQRTGATPDGRRRGENLAYSVSPMQGRDAKGLTALINSLARLPQRRAAGSTSAIVETEPVLFEDENLDHLVVLLQTAIQAGVGQLQFNVVNEETLRRAQAEPERYRNLAVRVSGFSQRFCLLSKEIQDHIIARTKHATF